MIAGKEINLGKTRYPAETATISVILIKKGTGLNTKNLDI